MYLQEKEKLNSLVLCYSIQVSCITQESLMNYTCHYFHSGQACREVINQHVLPFAGKTIEENVHTLARNVVTCYKNKSN